MNRTMMRLPLCCLFAFMVSTEAWTQDFATVTTEAELIALHESSNIPRGDTELNGDVNFDEFRRFVDNFDRRDPSLTYFDGDLNLDGVVDLGDLAIFTNNFLAEGYQPEPDNRPANADFSLHIDDNNKIIIRNASSVEIRGIELYSPSGGLVPADPFPGLGIPFFPAPFTSGITGTTPTSERLIWTNITPVTIDGDLATGATATTDDITLRWIELGSYAVFSPMNDPNNETDLSLIDLDRSGEIDFADFLILSGNFGQIVEIGTDGDIDLDGNVAFSDFLILSREFGNVVQVPAVATVPEPGGNGVFLLTTGFCILLRRTSDK